MTTNIKTDIDINKYKITNHAKLRFAQRVSKTNNPSTKEIKIWLNKALNKGYIVDKKKGRNGYRYGSYLIVVDYKTIVTISYYGYNEFKYIQEELNRGDISRLKKEVRHRVNNRKRIMIKCNEIDNKRIMSESKKDQKLLEEEIMNLKKEASKIRKQIKALINVASIYGRLPD